IVFGAPGEADVRVFQGTFRDWHDAQQRERAIPQSPKGPTPHRSAKATKSKASRTTSSSKTSKRAVEAAEAKIESIEARITSIDRELSDPAVFSDGARCKALSNERSELKGELDRAEAEWSSLVE